MSAPITCDKISIDQDDGVWPSFFTWPAMTAPTNGQLYGSGSTNAFQLVLGNESG